MLLDTASEGLLERAVGYSRRREKGLGDAISYLSHDYLLRGPKSEWEVPEVTHWGSYSLPVVSLWWIGNVVKAGSLSSQSASMQQYSILFLINNIPKYSLSHSPYLSVSLTSKREKVVSLWKS
jgi:hypothetical protein